MHRWVMLNLPKWMREKKTVEKIPEIENPPPTRNLNFDPDFDLQPEKTPVKMCRSFGAIRQNRSDHFAYLWRS